MVIFNSYIIHNQVGKHGPISGFPIGPSTPLWSRCGPNGSDFKVVAKDDAATVASTLWSPWRRAASVGNVMERTEGEAVEWCGMFFSPNKDGMAHAIMIHNVGLDVYRWNTVLSASFWLGELPSDMDFSRCKYWVLCVQQGFAYAEAVEVRAQACLPGA